MISCLGDMCYIRRIFFGLRSGKFLISTLIHCVLTKACSLMRYGLVLCFIQKLFINTKKNGIKRIIKTPPICKTQIMLLLHNYGISKSVLCWKPRYVIVTNHGKVIILQEFLFNERDCWFIPGNGMKQYNAVSRCPCRILNHVTLKVDGIFLHEGWRTY